MANDDDNGVLDPPDIGDDDAVDAAAETASVGAMPQATGASPGRSRGGRPKGTRNRATIEREAAAAAPTGVGAAPTTSRPAGKTGNYPGEAGKIPNDADLLWMHVLEEIQAEGWSPYDMEIRVDRQTPPPGGPVAGPPIEGSAVQGDAMTSPATALRNYVIDWIHLPSGIMGPAVYALHFCWKNKAQFFRRGELRVPSRNEIIAMKQSESARNAQAGAAGVGAPNFGFQPPQHAPSPSPQYAPPPQPYYPGFGALPVTAQPFDADAERARIRHELEREFEMQSMRREIEDLRRRPPPQPQYAPHYQPPQPQPQPGGRRAPHVGAGAQQQPYYESDDDRTARVVMQVLQQAGVLPQQRAQQPAGFGASSPAVVGVVSAASSGADDFERAMDTVTRGKKVFKRMKELFDDEEPEPKAKGTGAAPSEGEEEVPKLRFQGTGQRWKDGREVMMPIDQQGEPIFPTTLPAALATGFANPFLLEPIAQGVGAMMQRMAAVGLGAQPPQRDPNIHVQQVQQQPPAPVPYQPQQMPVPQPPQPQAAPSPPAEGSFNFS